MRCINRKNVFWLFAVATVSALSRYMSDPMPSPGLPTDHAHPQTPKNDSLFYASYFSDRLEAMRMVSLQFCSDRQLPVVKDSALRDATCESAAIISSSLQRQLAVHDQANAVGSHQLMCSSGRNAFGAWARALPRLQQAAGAVWLRANALAFGGHFIARKNGMLCGVLQTRLQSSVDLLLAVFKAGVSGKLPHVMKLLVMKTGYFFSHYVEDSHVALTAEEFRRLRLSLAVIYQEWRSLGAGNDISRAYLATQNVSTQYLDHRLGAVV